jgi:hypothetical protein
MAFESVSGLKGKVYVPEERPGRVKKYNCKDCYSCQICSELRCKKCLDQKTLSKKNPSKEGHEKPSAIVCNARIEKVVKYRDEK